MAEEVRAINQAHVLMLTRCGILDKRTCSALLRALRKVTTPVEISETDVEDIHAYFEEEVTRQLGNDVAGNLHIAKSRNDQVATAIRMRLRRSLVDIINRLLTVQESILKLASKHVETIIPGYTHTHPAQPITFAHLLVAYSNALGRDAARLTETVPRVNLSPMGACALAGTSVPIDRSLVARLLGFDGIIENTVDAVTSRDFAIEFLGNLSTLSLDISRIAQDLILYTSPQIGLIELPDEFAFPSSSMPQKKNPDVLEVIRARAARLQGELMSALTIQRSLPSSYNLDFQELTPLLWAAHESTRDILEVLAELIPKVRVSKDVAESNLLTFTMATEVANMLALTHKLPFRTAHAIVGKAVKRLVRSGKPLVELKARTIEEAASGFWDKPINITNEQLANCLSVRNFIHTNKVEGGPSPTHVKRSIQRTLSDVMNMRTKIRSFSGKLSDSMKSLQKAATDMSRL